MEDTLGVAELVIMNVLAIGLNPYCNGRYSWRSLPSRQSRELLRLNPYCNGRYSWS